VHLHVDGVCIFRFLGTCAIELRGQFGVARVIDRDQRRTTRSGPQGLGIRQASARAERLQKASRLSIDAAELKPLLKDERPGKDGKNKKDAENNAR